MPVIPTDSWMVKKDMQVFSENQDVVQEAVFEGQNPK